MANARQIAIMPKVLKAVGAPPIFMRKVAAMWNLFLSVVSFFMLMGVGLPFGADILVRLLFGAPLLAQR